MEINILIVDDDEILVNKISDSVDWKSLGITMTFTANNIRQAESIIEEYDIDIVLSDIEMPQGSGLELLEWIRNNNKKIECLILSSYAYFGYAQKAIELKAAEYLLKPASNKDIERALTGIVDRIRSSESAEQADETCANYRNEELWSDYFASDRVDEKKVQQIELIYGKGQFRVGLIRMIPDSDHRNKKDLSIDHFVIKNMVKELADINNVAVLYIQQISDYISLTVTREDSIDDQHMLAERVYENMTERFHFPVCIYLGDLLPVEKLLPDKQELLRLECCAVVSGNGLLVENEWKGKETARLIPPWDEWERQMFLAENPDDVGAAIIKYLEGFEKDNQLTKKMLAGFRADFVQMLNGFMKKCEKRLSDLFDDEEFQYQYEASGESVRTMTEFIRNFYHKLSGNKAMSEENDSAVSIIKDYIDNHFGEELSRKQLANMVFLSEDYISKLFRAETGMYIPEYITGVRIGKAQEYLLNSDLPIGSVALDVGYNNFSYFSKNFRDIVGCTPNEYRRKNAKPGIG